MTAVTVVLIAAAGLASGMGIGYAVLLSEPDVRERYEHEREERRR